MPVAVHVQILQGNMNRFLYSPGGPIVRKVHTYTRRAANQIRQDAPVKTGAGRAAIHEDVILRGRAVVGRIFLPDHLIYQDQGTGEYAGRGPIRPKHGQFLVWESDQPQPGQRRRGRNPNLHFAPKVRGVKPKNFVFPAVRRAIPWPVRGRR